jgi:hypothetical protein
MKGLCFLVLAAALLALAFPTVLVSVFRQGWMCPGRRRGIQSRRSSLFNNEEPTMTQLCGSRRGRRRQSITMTISYHTHLNTIHRRWRRKKPTAAASCVPLQAICGPTLVGRPGFCRLLSSLSLFLTAGPGIGPGKHLCLGERVPLSPQAH